MSLHVEVLGQGEDLVLLHGWGMHSGVWHGVREALAARYRIHLVDLPGMGLSPALPSATLDGLAGAVEDVMPPVASLCGWSLGSQVAMRLALRAPARVRRLVLVGSTPCFVGTEDWTHGVPAGVFNRFAAEVEADYRLAMDRFLSLQGFGGTAARSLIRTLREHFAMAPRPAADVLREALQILLQTDLRTEAARIVQPAMLVHGDRDTLVPAGAAAWLAQVLPSASLRLIPGASHAPFISHPDVFIGALEQCMEAVPWTPI